MRLIIIMLGLVMASLWWSASAGLALLAVTLLIALSIMRLIRLRYLASACAMAAAFLCTSHFWAVGLWTFGWRILLKYLPWLHAAGTFTHELGHGLACVFTGGTWRRFAITDQGRSGVALTSVANNRLRFLVVAAGYLTPVALGLGMAYVSVIGSPAAHLAMLALLAGIAAATLLIASSPLTKALTFLIFTGLATLTFLLSELYLGRALLCMAAYLLLKGTLDAWHHLRNVLHSPVTANLDGHQLGTIMGVNPGICAAGLFAVIAVLDVVVVNLLI